MNSHATPADEPRALAGEPGCYQLGDCVVDRVEATVTRDGSTVALTPRTAQVLDRLVAEAGEVVPRDALLDAAWQHRDVSDESLSRAISDLRQALGDRARAPRYIETIPRVGYRLIPSPRPEPEDTVVDARPARRRWLIAVAFAMAAIVVLLLAWPEPRFETPGFAPLASGSELEHSPMPSADGERIWYVAVDRYASGHVPEAAIQVMNRDGSGRETVLRHRGDVVTGFAISADERRLAYTADDGFQCRVLTYELATADRREIDRCGRSGNVQRLAWVDQCLVFSRFDAPGRQRLGSWCPDGTGPLAEVPDEVVVEYKIPLDWQGESGRMLVSGALGQLAVLDVATGRVGPVAVDGPVIDAAFDGAHRLLALVSDGGAHRLAAFSLPHLEPLGSAPAVPYAHFIERASAADLYVVGTFGWQRRIGTVRVDGDDRLQVTTPERDSFRGISVSPEGDHVVFARRGAGGWRVWSRDLTSGRDRAIGPGRDTAGIGLALAGGVVHVEPLGDGTSRLVWTDLVSPAEPHAMNVPFQVGSLIGGPNGSFAARCRSESFDGVCHGDAQGLEPWIRGASHAAWDAVDRAWYVAIGSAVSQVTPSGLLPTYELPAAQSTGQWVVHDGRVFAFTRDAESATPQLVTRALRGEPDERAFALDADGWNLAVTADGRLFYTEQVYDSGSADLFVSTPRG